MCFSAGASFAGAALLTSIGAATIKRASSPSQKLFAEIPLFFAFQQCAEGIVWLTLRSGEYQSLQTAATYIFLIMALVIWPVMMPLAVMRMEENRKRRNIIKAVFPFGIFVSAYYVCCLAFFNVTPLISGFHIQYIGDFPEYLRNVVFGAYIIATISPLFISSVKRMSLFGSLIVVSCIITGIFYKEYLTSVWCFFAALISIVIYIIVKESQEELTPADFKMRRIFSDHIRWIDKWRK